MMEAVAALLGYLLGSVPFGIVMARAFGLGDLRKIGSGNIGATNVLRAGSRPAAALTLILDAGKGAIAVLVARAFLDETAALSAGMAAFLGHCYPVWLGFRGGKGVATFLGTVLAVAWPLGLIACASWAVIAAVTRISSLSALVAAITLPLWAIVLDRMSLALPLAAMAFLIVLRHRENVARLMSGDEPRIGRK